MRPAILVAAALFAALPGAAGAVTVGSKKFTENVILADIATRSLRSESIEAEHRRELGGTRVLWNALKAGEIDIYPEYTGTLIREIFTGPAVRTTEQLQAALAESGVSMTRPLGFNNTYVLGMKTERAAALGIDSISALAAHPALRLGFSNEFLDRADGWRGLKARYRLPHTDVRGLDHDLAYRGIAAGELDVIDLYSTDAEIRYYALRPLRDDLNFFPEYQAVFLYRAALESTAPAAVARLKRLEGSIDAARMTDMNAAVKIDGRSESAVAGDFLRQEFGLELRGTGDSRWRRFLVHTRDHLLLVGISLSAAILVAVPLGIAAARHAGLGRVVLAAAGVIQTIPSLALLVFMIPLLGIGGPPAVAALFLYSLLPIVRNTFSGLQDIPAHVRESAVVLGLPPGARLRLVELPLAARSILSGIKTSAVINVGTATLGALIGAGGYGQPILTGIRLDDTALILEGAIPAALLALAVQGLFDLLERLLLPAGLRYRQVA